MPPGTARVIDPSLPLMGIGNPRGRPRAGRGRSLITPHGDWKPRKTRRGGRIKWRSLPLMGIGNLQIPADPYRPGRLSLPLMGIGNWTPARSSGGRCASHYPSWGLETLARLAPRRVGPLLITPHGDWKPSGIGPGCWPSIHSLPLMGIGNPPSSDSAGTAPDRSLPLMGIGNRGGALVGGHETSSLPLMGIGNRRCARPGRRAGRAHYPSWGLETTPMTPTPGPPPATHYPSWGLETEVAPDFRRSRHGLITPHGDWKPSAPLTWRAAGRWSHYPSWGLETRPQGSDNNRLAYRSLPLMGIGNLLMLQLGVPDNSLITPHGDWKHDTPLRSQSSAISSLPLMGIGNTSCSWSASPTSGPHYPSWGLETADADGGHGGRCDLITPHGDWKLRRLRGVGRPRARPAHYPSWGLETPAADDVEPVVRQPLITPHGDWKPWTVSMP